MSGLALRSKKGRGGASSTKRKRADDESLERSSAERRKGDEDDSFEQSSDQEDGGSNASAQDDAGPTDDADGEYEDDEEVVERPRRSSHQKGKRRKVAKSSAKPVRATGGQEPEDDSSSGPSGPGRGTKVERHATAVRRAKRHLKKEKKELEAKGEKVTKTLDVSESSTEGKAPRKTYVAGKKGQSYVQGRNRAGRRVARAMDRSVLDREEDYPPRTAEEFKRLIPKPQYDEYCTQEQQAQLVERLSADTDFKKRLNVSQFVVSVWKTAFRFTGRLATDIVGPKTGLEFKSDSHKGDGPVWTQRFCEALTSIILHPLFKLNTQKMALAIQWAVICRTGYTSKYKLSGCKNDFLRELAAVVEKHQDGSRTPGELLEAAAYECEEACGPDAEPPTWLQFLGHIEKKAVRSSDDAIGIDDVGGGPYFVNTKDLQVVRSALDRMKHLSLRMFVDSRQVVDAVMPTRTKWDVPTEKLTQNAIRAVLLQEERNKERVRRGGSPEPIISPRRDHERPSWYDADRESGSGGKNATDDDDPFVMRVNERAAPTSAVVSQGHPQDRSIEGIAEARRSSESLGEHNPDSQPQEDDEFMFVDGALGGGGGGGFSSLGEGPPSSPEGVPLDQEEPVSNSNQPSQVQPSNVEDDGTEALPPSLPAPSLPVRIRGIEADFGARPSLLPYITPKWRTVPSTFQEGLSHHPDIDSVLAALSREAVWVGRYSQLGGRNIGNRP